MFAPSYHTSEKMTDTLYTKIRPADVYIVIPRPEGDRTETASPDDRMEIRPTNIEFFDAFGQLLRKHGNMTVEWYASMMGLERHRFSSAITALTGMSAHEWILEYIGIFSCTLLENTRLPVSKIADVMGFTSESAFSQCFIRIRNCSAYEWRNKITYHTRDKTRTPRKEK